MAGRKDPGQALLIIVLIMTVALTIGLAVVSRSVTDIAISYQEEEAARAFSTAEAGIEDALAQNLAIGGAPLSGSIGLVDYTVSASAQGGGRVFIFPQAIEAGETQTVWLVGHNADGEPDAGEGSFGGNVLVFHWGNEGQAADEATTPALEASLFYEDGGLMIIKRNAFDPNEARRADNDFGPPEIDGPYSLGGKNFAFKRGFSSAPAGTPYILRLTLFYNDEAQILGVWTDSDLPFQGKCYEAVATVSSSGVSRKVKQCQFYKAPPKVFDYVLFSQGRLAK